MFIKKKEFEELKTSINAIKEALQDIAKAINTQLECTTKNSIKKENIVKVHKQLLKPVEQDTTEFAAKKKAKKVFAKYIKDTEYGLDNIRIENLDELYTQVDPREVSIHRLNTLLKFAAKNYSYQTIATKLGIQVSSIKVDYNYLSKFNFVINSTDKPHLTTKVIVSEISEYPVNLLSGNAKSAYNALVKHLNTWKTHQQLEDTASISNHTVTAYLYELRRLNLIERRKSPISYNYEYRIKSV